MKKSVRLAVIGRGRWGKNIIKTLEALPECVVAYVVTREYKELLKKSDIDGVIIATPPSTHAEIALPFIERGLPVFIEKPMTTSVVSAKRLLAASKKHGTPVFVGHIHLYNPAYHAAKKAIQKVGRLRMIVGEGANNGPVRNDYSAMWDWAPHDLSMMLDMVGKMPTRVQAWGVAKLRPGTKLWDFSQIKLEFPGGVTGIVMSSWLMPQKRKRLNVVGEKGSVVYDDTLGEKKVSVLTGTEVTYPTYARDMPLTLEMKEFLAATRTGKKPKTDVLQGLAVVVILEAAEKSIAGGGKLVRIKR